VRAGELERARALQTEAASLVEGGEWPWFAAFVHESLAATLQRLGAVEAAHALHRRSVAEGGAIGRGFVHRLFFVHVGGSPVARSLVALGTMALRDGNAAEAERRHLDGLARAELAADAGALALALEGLAAAAASAAEWARAALLLGAADAVRARARLPRGAFEAGEAAVTAAALGTALGPDLVPAVARGRRLTLAEALEAARRHARRPDEAQLRSSNSMTGGGRRCCRS
jgi:hypothetical protein